MNSENAKYLMIQKYSLNNNGSQTLNFHKI